MGNSDNQATPPGEWLGLKWTTHGEMFRTMQKHREQVGKYIKFNKSIFLETLILCFVFLC